MGLFKSSQTFLTWNVAPSMCVKFKKDAWKAQLFEKAGLPQLKLTLPGTAWALIEVKLVGFFDFWSCPEHGEFKQAQGAQFLRKLDRPSWNKQVLGQGSSLILMTRTSSKLGKCHLSFQPYSLSSFDLSMLSLWFIKNGSSEIKNFWIISSDLNQVFRNWSQKQQQWNVVSCWNSFLIFLR